MSQIISGRKGHVASSCLPRDHRGKTKNLPGNRRGTEPVTDVVYPDHDGKVVADTGKPSEWIAKIRQGLEILFEDHADVFVDGDSFWYPTEGNNKIRVAPAAMVVFGRPKGHRGAYLQWKEGNMAPQVVFDVLSSKTESREMKRKLGFYEKYGVEEYYLYDPDNTGPSGWIRSHKKLCPVENMRGFASPRLKIGFDIGNEPNLLRPDGQKFPA